MHKLKGDKIVDCLVRTRVPMKEYNFKWILEDYSRIKCDQMFKSPHFYPEERCPWWVCVNKTNAYFYLYLCRNGGSGEVQVKCEFTIASCNGKIWKNSILTLNFDNTTMSKTVIEALAIKTEEIRDKYNDIVYLTLEIKLYKMNINQLDSLVQYCFSSEEEFQRNIQKSTSEDLVKFYESHLNSDISLSIEGETLEVHKAILSARSPVFAKMFEQEMAEARKNVVVIEDVKIAAMKEVVAFMYGKAKRNYDYGTAVELYYASDKYVLKKLKETCGGVLASQLNAENAGQILTLADRHCDIMLKEKVMKFIIFNMKSCIRTEWWSNLMSTGNELSAELTEFIADFK